MTSPPAGCSAEVRIETFFNQMLLNPSEQIISLCYVINRVYQCDHALHIVNFI